MHACSMPLAVFSAAQPTPSNSGHVISPCEGVHVSVWPVGPTLVCALTPILSVF